MILRSVRLALYFLNIMQFKPSSSPPVRTQIRSVCNQPSNTPISVSSTRQFVFLPQERITFSPSLTSWRQEYLAVIRYLCLDRRKTISRRTKRGRRATSLIELSTNSPQYIATIANFILAVLFKINRTSEVFNLEMLSSCTNWHLISHVLTNGGSGRSRITQTGGREGAYPWVWAKNLLFENFLPKTAWKWKKLDRDGRAFLVQTMKESLPFFQVCMCMKMPINKFKD